jgi:putative ATPase
MELPLDGDHQPLAARMRPKTLDEFVGQEHIVGPGRLLRRAIEADQLHSIVLSGPPGTGKTTLARVIAQHTRSQFLSINAVLSGVKDIREAIVQARSFTDRTNRRTLLFVDEVHRWNRSQQDALLPWVENGLVVLIGATTENPFFEVNRALLSRSRVFILTPLTDQDLRTVLENALKDPVRGYGAFRVEMEPDARDHLIATSSGDARTLLNALELAVETGNGVFPFAPGTEIQVTLAIAEESIQHRAILYDKDGDYHFDTISAFIKSVRGSDPDAALYWLARMVTAGEDPRYVLRRLLILASEDIGMADPNALTVVNSCAAAYDRIGMPEGQFLLSQATLYCSTAPKSNSTMGFFDALKAVEEAQRDEVPDHLRDGSRDGDHLGHGRNYLYPHAYREHWVAQQYLPDSLQGTVFFQPGQIGWEGQYRHEIEERRRLQLAADQEHAAPIRVAAPDNSPGDRWLNRATRGVPADMETLRSRVLQILAPEATDRVLLCGHPVQLFVWDILRSTPGGLAAIWSEQELLLKPIRDLLENSPVQESERPQLVAPIKVGEFPAIGSNGADGKVHPGPFDRILHRSGPLDDPPRLLEWLSPLLEPRGRQVYLDINPAEGTRLSTVLDLPPLLHDSLVAAEAELYASRPDLWDAALDDAGLTECSSRSTIATSSEKTLPSGLIQHWLADDQPLGAAIARQAGKNVAADLRDHVGRLPVIETTWRRVFFTVTIERVAKS